MLNNYRFPLFSAFIALTLLLAFISTFGTTPDHALAQTMAATSPSASGTSSATASNAPVGDVARGRFLVQIGGCVGCHGTPDLATGGNIPLAGGREFTNAQYGVFHAPNLTALHDMDYANFEGALRRGLEPYSGEMLAPNMPYMVYHGLSDSDVASILAYLHSLAPVANNVPLRKPAPALANLKPLPAVSGVVVTPDSSAEYGRYLVENIANCGSCHSPRNQADEYIAGRALSGGTRNVGTTDAPLSGAPIMGSVLTSAGFTRDNFIAMFRTGIRPWGAPLPVQMPLSRFSVMSDSDLTAIWNFLQTKKLDAPWGVPTAPPTSAATVAATAAK